MKPSTSSQLDEDDSNAIALEGLAALYADEGRIDESIDCLNRWKANENDLEQVALIYLKHGHGSRIISQLLPQGTAPGRPTAFKNLGLAHQALGDLQESAACFVEATQANDTDGRATAHLEALLADHPQNRGEGRRVPRGRGTCPVTAAGLGGDPQGLGRAKGIALWRNRDRVNPFRRWTFLHTGSPLVHLLGVCRLDTCSTLIAPYLGISNHWRQFDGKVSVSEYVTSQ